MIYLIILICIYLVLGFMFAWVAGLVASEDVLVRTGVLILLLTAAVRILLGIVLPADLPGGILIFPLVNFSVLVVMTHVIAKIDWGKSAIIAAIYTAILFLIGLALGAVLA